MIEILKPKIMNLEKSILKLSNKARFLMTQGNIAEYLETLIDLHNVKKQVQPIRIKAQ